MKKLLLTSFVLVIATVSLSAQTEYGIRAGFFNSERNTNFSFDNDGLGDSGNFNGGIYLGAFVGFKMSEKFYIQPEITYASVKNDFDQLIIPILGKYKIGKKFNILLGPSFGFLLSDNESFKKFNFAATLGVSYDIFKFFSVELRYNYSITESLKDDFQGSFNPSAKFNSFQLGLVYRFD